MKSKLIKYIAFLVTIFSFFILLKDNVFAATYDNNGNFIPVYAKIDNTTIVAIEQPTNRSVVKTTTSNQKYFDITFIVNYDLPEDITNNPYVVVLFKSFTTDIKITRQSTCNNECFSSTYQLYTLGKTVWQPQGYESYLMALVLPISKYNYDQNMNLYQVSDILRFTYTGNEPYLDYEFFNVYGTNSLTGIDTGYQNTIETINKIEELKNSLNTSFTNLGTTFTNSLSELKTIYQQGVQKAQEQLEELDNIYNKTDYLGQVIGSANIDTTEHGGIGDFFNDNSLEIPNTIQTLYLIVPNFITSLKNGASNTCSPYTLGTLYNEDIVFPCIHVDNYVGSTIWGYIDILGVFSILLGFRALVIDIYFNTVLLKAHNVLNEGGKD